jgi:short-subunit dehydrogenase
MQEKKVVVITGASSGIGRATARTLARKGYDVVLAARREDALEDAARECELLGANTLTHKLDVSREVEVLELVRQARQRFGHIDVWVNNAAVAMMGPFLDTPTEDIRRLMDINVMGCIHGAKAVLPVFKSQGHGVLINVSSITGITGQPYSVAYSASKFAIRGMALSLRQELVEEKNIHICTVLPATVDTPLFESAANFMGREVKAMPPVVDAQEVADEIARLAVDPKPEVIVGGMGIQNTLMKYLTPDLFARMQHKHVKEEHFKEEREGPKHGNLYQPALRSSVGGGWTDGRSRALKMRNRNIMWTGAAVVGALAGAAAYLMKDRELPRRRHELRDPTNTPRRGSSTAGKVERGIPPVIPVTKEEMRGPETY